MNDCKTPFDEAMIRSVLDEFSDIPTREEDIPLSFTDAFEKDVREFIEYTQRGKRRANLISRILLIAAIAGILMVSSSLLSFSSVVEPEQDGSYIFNRTSAAYDDLYYLYEFYVDQEIVDAAPDTIEDVYYPTYVPEGFILDHKFATVDGASAVWRTAAGLRIAYSQTVLFGSENRIAISYDPANDVAGVFDLGDFEVFRLKNRHEIIYIWSDHRYYYELYVDVGVDEETMKKIFESIEWMPDEIILMT